MADGMRERQPGVWEIRVRAGRDPDSGRYRQVSRTFRGSERAAARFRAKLVTEIDEGYRGSEAPVSRLLDRWLDLIADDRSPTTIAKYREYQRRYLTPALGPTRVTRVTTADLDALYLRWARGLCAGRCKGDCPGHRPLAPATIRQAHAMLHRAFGQAQRWGWVPSNPATGATLPRGTRSAINPPTPTQLRTLIDGAAASRNPELGVYLRVAAATGARRGEVCGLRWADLAGDVLEIVRAVVTDRGTLTVKAPKTRQSRRIALDPGTVKALAAHRTWMADRADLAGVSLGRDSYVFSDDMDGARPWRPDRVTLAFVRLARRYGIDARLHDVRHAHATQLLAAGTDIRTVAGRIGHTQPSTTLNIYSHWVPAADQAAAATMGDLLDG